ncbi:MAG: maleylacetoacetate isomerase [Beijerinckiaceae bacterium]
MDFFGFFRSSAAYRCRIALNLKGLSCRFHAVNLRDHEQRTASYLSRNPQGLVPMLEIDGRVLTQSLAIIEWLEECHPSPALLPSDPFERAEVRAFALAIACDLHPLNNTRVLDYLKERLGQDQTAIAEWYRHWTQSCLIACEELVVRAGRTNPYCFGKVPGLADICLVPQLFNARRFNCDLDAMPTLVAIDRACGELPAFAEAHPDRQPDAVP